MPKAKKTEGKVNKSAWIREQNASTPAKDIVEKAKAQGISLTLAQVYTARSTAKKLGTPIKRGPGRPPNSEVKRGPGRPPKAGGSTSAIDLHRQFVALAVRIGTDEATRLLARVAQPNA